MFENTIFWYRHTVPYSDTQIHMFVRCVHDLPVSFLPGIVWHNLRSMHQMYPNYKCGHIVLNLFSTCSQQPPKEL